MDRAKYNLGLELLRALMCYGVVATHFWNPWEFYHLTVNIPRPLWFVAVMRNYAVPVFMLMAFYFTLEAILGRYGQRRVDRSYRIWFNMSHKSLQ